MFVTLSEARLSNLIKELEGIDAPIEEITHRMDKYAAKVFGHLGNYGVRMQSMVNLQGNLATFVFSLDPAYSEESRDERIAGLQLLNPVSVTVTANDLPALVLNVVALGGVRQVWPDVMQQFERILPSEILDLLEKAAARSLNTPGVPHTEQDFNKWCVEYGLPIPGRERREREQQEQQEIAQREAAEKDAIQRRWQYADGHSDIQFSVPDDTDEF